MQRAANKPPLPSTAEVPCSASIVGATLAVARHEVMGVALSEYLVVHRKTRGRPSGDVRSPCHCTPTRIRQQIPEGSCSSLYGSHRSVF